MNSKIQQLKQWRDELAQRSGKPAYYILTNKNLEDALRLKPTSPQELESLSGWGPRKVQKYGQEVLNIINFDESLKENEIENQEKNFSNDEAVLSVAQYINFINLTVQQFGETKISGEINDLSGVERGLAFFDLKDVNDHESTIQCVVFRNNFQYLSHLLEDGLEVVIYGMSSIYPKNGNFKFMISRIEPVGEGSYKKILEKLRKKLLDKGYFGEERKRNLPTIIKRIGLITSNNGAAIHDFRRNLADFGLEVFLKNVYVEGDQAENSIIEAINFFNKQAKNLDIIVIIRGGGSWESLKAFNSERVVEAVVASKIPIMTGIGHENDETFVGMSSDFNCSTPSIVATQISQFRENILDECLDLGESLKITEGEFLNQFQNQISNYLNRLSSRVERIFSEFNQLTKNWVFLLNEKIFQISGKLQSINSLAKKLISGVEFSVKKEIGWLELREAKINILNPKNILKKGYGVVYSERRKIINSIKKLKLGEVVKVELEDGSFGAEIIKIENKKV